jgi:hypothetical protein
MDVDFDPSTARPLYPPIATKTVDIERAVSAMDQLPEIQKQHANLTALVNRELRARRRWALRRYRARSLSHMPVSLRSLLPKISPSRKSQFHGMMVLGSVFGEGPAVDTRRF